MKKEKTQLKFYMTEKEKFRIFRFFLVAFLLGILISFSFHAIQVHDFNTSVKKVGTIEDGVTDTNATVSIHPRGLATDTWIKEFNGQGGYGKATGLIYEAQVKNNSEYEITGWSLRVNIHKRCLINNGWCGTFEIHQFDEEGAEKVQTLNLQDAGYVEIDHFFTNQELMIPLSDGDYFIYYPSEEANENIVPVNVLGDESYAGVKTGFIMYFIGSNMEFADAQLSYNVHADIFASKKAKICVGAFLIWICFLMVYISLAIYRRISYKRLEQYNMFINSAMSVFTGFFEAKDSYTRGHSKRVAEYSMMLARACGLNEDELRTVYHIAYMHDCGKTYISDTILKKEGRLTDEEFEIMKSHTTKGAEMVQDFTAIKGLTDGVLHHHERYDGNGYPSGLKGEEIPWIARVICIADSYDAMSSDRCYRKKLYPSEILKEFERCKGTQFDPKLTDIFVSLIDKDRV